MWSDINDLLIRFIISLSSSICAIFVLIICIKFIIPNFFFLIFLMSLSIKYDYYFFSDFLYYFIKYMIEYDKDCEG